MSKSNSSGAKFSESVKNIIQISREIALEIGNDFIDEGHLFLAIIKQSRNHELKFRDESSSIILSSLIPELNTFESDLTARMTNRSVKKLKELANVPLTKSCEKILKLSYLEAKQTNSVQINAGTLLLSILKNLSTSTSLKGIKISYDQALKVYISNNLKNQPENVKTDIHVQEKNLSLFFDKSEYSTTEISEIILALSELYHSISGGDELEIKGIQNLEYTQTLIPA